MWDIGNIYRRKSRINTIHSHNVYTWSVYVYLKGSCHYTTNLILWYFTKNLLFSQIAMFIPSFSYKGYEDNTHYLWHVWVGYPFVAGSLWESSFVIVAAKTMTG